ncbi:hypothetical protein JTE90_000240 [Oedothorax gibbosus]|uniref:Thioredoxin domain-containing protein n=1 Tax=Oedothorax gibbosus TaxID=931172 RepID=A0AAV6VC52_9ARAC|nr:hypothetical protein JTE90_000240 [Oedothorax gibbosus]
MFFRVIFYFCIPLIYIHAAKNELSESQKEIDSFEKILREESALVVLFTQPCCECTDCVEAEVLLGGMSKEIEENLGVLVARIREPSLKSRYGVKKVPAMAYVRNNMTAMYDGLFEFEEVYAWLQDNRFPATAELDDSSFEHLTQAATGATTGDWLVMFHDGTCCKNRELIHLETAGTKMRNKVNVASVNVLKAPETSERFKITSCPEVIFFRHQRLYRLSLPDITSTTLRRFSEGFYKNSKAERVPMPPSLFDKFRDKTILFYKKNSYQVFVGLVISTICIMLYLIASAIKSPAEQKSDKKSK